MINIKCGCLVTSCSYEKLSDDSRLTSKQSVKLAVFRRAMHNIGRDAAPASETTVSKLDKYLKHDSPGREAPIMFKVGESLDTIGKRTFA